MKLRILSLSNTKFIFLRKDCSPALGTSLGSLERFRRLVLFERPYIKKQNKNKKQKTKQNKTQTKTKQTQEQKKNPSWAFIESVKQCGGFLTTIFLLESEEKNE